MVKEHPSLSLAIAVCLFVAMIVGAQALAGASAPPVTQLSQTTVIGQTGFAYLAGVRLVIAGMLTAELDKQFHQYMRDSSIKDRTDLLPAMRLIQALNPQLEQPYYYVSYVLSMRGDWTGALNLAREGIRNNPNSGFLRANYVQLLLIQDKKRNLPEAVAQMRIALQPNMTYSSITDQFEAYGIFKAICHIIGDTKTEAWLAAEQKAMPLDAGSAGASNAGGLKGLLNAWQNSTITNE